MRLKKLLALGTGLVLCLSMAACGSAGKEAAQEATTEVVVVEDESLTGTVYKEFSDLLTKIYECRAGSAGSSARVEDAAKDLIEFSMNYGQESSSEIFHSFTDSWVEEKAEEYGDSLKENMKEEMDAVTEQAVFSEKDIDTDVAYLNVINGIYAAFEE